jgi:hypothetical protein
VSPSPSPPQLGTISLPPSLPPFPSLPLMILCVSCQECMPSSVRELSRHCVRCWVLQCRGNIRGVLPLHMCTGVLLPCWINHSGGHPLSRWNLQRPEQHCDVVPTLRCCSRGVLLSSKVHLKDWDTVPRGVLLQLWGCRSGVLRLPSVTRILLPRGFDHCVGHPVPRRKVLHLPWRRGPVP